MASWSEVMFIISRQLMLVEIQAIGFLTTFFMWKKSG